MKSVLFVFLLCLAAGTQATELETQTTAVVDDFADKLLTNLRPMLVYGNLDPFKVDDISEDFWMKVLFVNHTGHINLKNGWLQGISTIRRFGECSVTYDHRLLRLDITGGLDELIANFDYDAKFMIFHPDGALTAKITDQVVHIGLLFDLELMTVSLQRFELGKDGRLDLKLSGLGGITDAIVNGLVDAVTWLFKDKMMSSIEDQIRNVLIKILEKIKPLFPLIPTEPPATTSPTEASKIIQKILFNH